MCDVLRVPRIHAVSRKFFERFSSLRSRGWKMFDRKSVVSCRSFCRYNLKLCSIINYKQWLSWYITYRQCGNYDINVDSFLFRSIGRILVAIIGILYEFLRGPRCGLMYDETIVRSPQSWFRCGSQGAREIRNPVRPISDRRWSCHCYGRENNLRPTLAAGWYSIVEGGAVSTRPLLTVQIPFPAFASEVLLLPDWFSAFLSVPLMSSLFLDRVSRFTDTPFPRPFYPHRAKEREKERERGGGETCERMKRDGGTPSLRHFSVALL